MRLLSLLLLILLASCAKAAPKPPDSLCREQAFESSRFTVCDNGGGKLLLFAASRRDKPLRSFAEVMGKVEVARVAFAMNAGMFDDQGRPIGLAIVDRQLVKDINLNDGPGNFHLKPNGVFSVSVTGQARIAESAPRVTIQRTRTTELATQSGPMLVIAGKLHPKLELDGSSRLIRNGVGVRDGKALFVISETPISLGKFARFFRDKLKTPNALYFDGSVSSLWDPANGRQDSHSQLGPIVVAFKPEALMPDRAGRARP
jgi:uncharacterized protein YigE (DUF2233 family)